MIPLNPDDGNFINVKLSEIVTAEYSDGTYRFDVSTFAELNKTLVIFNDLNNDVPELLVNDMYGYTITQALEAGKLYVTVTTKLHEDNGIDGQYSGAIDVYAWNGPESSGGSSITVDSELSDTSTNPVQNKTIKAEFDKKEYKWIATTTGTGEAYEVMLDPAPTELYVGMEITIIPHTMSTIVNPTLNVNSLGAVEIRQRVDTLGSTVVAKKTGWLTANRPDRLMYTVTYLIDMGVSRPRWADIVNIPTEFTPISHEDAEGVYGIGYSDVFGHVKLSDSINSDENIDYGVAATPYAVKQAYSKAVEAYNKAAALAGDSGIALTVSDMLDVMSYTLEKPGYDKISDLTIYLSEGVDIVSYEGKAFYIEISTVDLSEDESADTICNSDGGCPYTLYNKDGTQVNPLSGGTRAIIAISENKALVLMKEGE